MATQGFTVTPTPQDVVTAPDGDARVSVVEAVK